MHAHSIDMQWAARTDTQQLDLLNGVQVLRDADKGAAKEPSKRQEREISGRKGG